MTDGSITRVGPNVLVGSLEGAEDEGALHTWGISHILTVDIHQPRTSANVVRLTIEITDEESSDLLSHLDEAVQFIEDCCGDGGCVLVHCRSQLSSCAPLTSPC